MENAIQGLTEADKEALFGRRFLTDRVAELDAQSLAEFLRRRLTSEAALELIGVTTGLEVWWDKAVSMFLRDELVGTSEGLEEIAGGTDRLPCEMANLLGDGVVQLNTAVTSIELKEQSVLIRTQPTDPRSWDGVPLRDGPVSELQGDYVICTIPFGVLRGIVLRG